MKREFACEMSHHVGPRLFPSSESNFVLLILYSFLERGLQIVQALSIIQKR